MYQVYSTHTPKGDNNSWVLTQEGTHLSRREAAVLSQAIKNRDDAPRVVVYAFGRFKYMV